MGAASSMIAVEHEAVVEAKKSAADLQKADAVQMNKLKAAFDAKIKSEHDNSVKAQSNAQSVMARMKAMKAAITHERLILKEEQAKSKDGLLKSLKAQIMNEAHKFKKAAMDWQFVKAKLKAQERTSKASARDANNKLAALAKQQRQDATAAGAKSAVNAAMHRAEASVAPKKKSHKKATLLIKTTKKIQKPIDAPVHHSAMTELSEAMDESDEHEANDWL